MRKFRQTSTISSVISHAFYQEIKREYRKYGLPDLDREAEASKEIRPYIPFPSGTRAGADAVSYSSPHRQELSNLTRRGLAVYEDRLRTELEPQFNGQVVAIHVDSGDHEVAPSSGGAMRAMRKRRPTGELVLHTIGTAADTGLAARILGIRIMERRS